jgi:putative ABC transport system substrate-binding protein
MLRLRRFLRISLLAGLFAALMGLGRPALAYVVCVVSSDKAPAFQEASDSLTQDLVRSGVARQDIAQFSLAEYLESPPTVQDSKLLISLGTEAFRQIAAQNGKAAVLAALIPRISFERVLQEGSRRNATTMSALYLDQPFGRQLDLVRLALPNLRRVGVLWGAESISQQPLWAAALQARGLEGSEGQYTEGQPLIGALRTALRDADVLLAVADGNVYNTNTVSNILLTSYRAKTPVIAFSPAYVKAGALLSVHTTPAQAGVRVAAIASHYLLTGTMPPSQYPNDFSINVNEYVARSLGLTLDAKDLTDRLRRLEKRP